MKKISFLNDSLFSYSFPYSVSWNIFPGDVHLVIGLDGADKKNLSTLFSSLSFPIVSFEEASNVIEEERNNDDSEFIEGGVDHGRCVRTFLNLQEKHLNEKINTICDIEHILDRGLKYLSTGEMKRTLLYKALASSSPLLVLDNPFDGLDTHSRTAMLSAIQILSRNKTAFVIFTEDTNLLDSASHIVYADIDDANANHTNIDHNNIEHTNGEHAKNVFIGTKEQFLHTDIYRTLAQDALKTGSFDEAGFENIFSTSVRAQTDDALYQSHQPQKKELVRMVNVTVQWDGRKVLDNINWTVYEGDHTLVQGKNGCGKTTLLELITGDNPQVYANDVYLFGAKRGSGESIWDIKAKLGIVSYKLHLEHRLVRGYTVEQVIVSGFYDSIGLYTKPNKSEIDTAHRWIDLAGMRSLASKNFSTLSYGEQRAVLILRAVVKHPPLLILDEPCHSLDAQSKAFVLALLQKIALIGKTTLIHVTHDPEEILPCEKYVFQFLTGEIPMYRVDKNH